MIITHKISLDLLTPEKPERIEVKQGDICSRYLEIQLFAGGEPCPLASNVTPALRWCASDPDTGESAGGICDTLEDGNQMFQISDHKVLMILPPQMLSLPGLVRADLLLMTPAETLATFNFEFYVNPAPVDGTAPEAASFYKLVTLNQINDAISALQAWQGGMDENFAHLEQEVFRLKDMVENL